ncbi:hypothetical protein HAV22_18720 [Massilia sp. TW-1]|uniref:Uncharacterized protein n=1 Tax=Telluria antibiotica TaxID=2717319 RepID=A0ABX0PE82_9BURK|nr:hypothetical protein [Telluria antibiotica]NIA55672.1 hypothetical protein [Telluria antibiotica]
MLAEQCALVDTGHLAEAATKIRSMTSTHVNGKKVLARGLILRRSAQSAPFLEAAKAAAVAKNKRRRQICPLYVSPRIC